MTTETNTLARNQLPAPAAGAKAAASAGKARRLRIGAFKTTPEHGTAVQQVQEWTRRHFSLPDEATVMISEVACVVPGCPPLETVIAFWTDSGDRRHFKIFKAVAEVSADDMPPAWLMDSLFAFESGDFECC